MHAVSIFVFIYAKDHFGLELPTPARPTTPLLPLSLSFLSLSLVLTEIRNAAALDE